MSIIVDRKKSREIFDRAAENNVGIAIFGTASHWNTEAILIAAETFAQRYGIDQIPVVVSNTFTYSHMPQAERMLYCGNPKTALMSHMSHLHALCGGKYAMYPHVAVLPHLDHADPEKDHWALTAGSQYYSSVMFDAQRFPYEENVKMTSDYVKAYGNDVLVEGIMEMLNVEGGLSDAASRHSENYCELARDFIKRTGIDFLVADLGTEQQASSVGNSFYDQERARMLTRQLGKKMLVLHGTSCLSEQQMNTLPHDGVIRVNMWTRIAREAGQYAAQKAAERMARINKGEFDAADSRAYLNDCTDKAAEIMFEMMELFGYSRWR